MTGDRPLQVQQPDVHVLLGSEVTRSGDILVKGGAAFAAACTPGAIVTIDALRDANEDAALLASAVDGTWLAAVVDGNGTAAGAHAVVRHLVGCVRELLAAPRPDVVGAIEDALQALDGVRRAGASATGASVTLVVGRGSRLWVWTRGDTAAVLVADGRIRALSGVVPPPLVPVPVPAPVEVERGASEVVVLASDGFFDALGRTWVEVVGVADGMPGDVAWAHAAAALSCDAVDAVTVAVVSGPAHMRG